MTNLLQALRQHHGSVVLDLSHLEPSQVRRYLDGVASGVETFRSSYGRPHWVVIDKAHGLLAEGGPISDTFAPARGGYCYVTYQPEGACAAALASIDLTLTPLVHDPSSPADPPRALFRLRGGSEIAFDVDARLTPHVRHRHKYADTPLPIRHRFAFRDQNGRVICSPGTLQEFEQQLRLVPAETVQHHALNRDFSRWSFTVLADRELGALLFGAENELTARYANDRDHFRQRLLTDVRQRYLGEEGGQPNTCMPT
jgi:hypothetical protein